MAGACQGEWNLNPNQHRNLGKSAFESDSGTGSTSVLCCSLPGPYSWLAFSVGEDPETRRLRTVKNIADLRQNLEETMSSLRGTQVTHR